MTESESIYRLKVYCSVPNCKNSVRNSPNKLFFSLPKNPQLRQQWWTAMKRDEKRNPRVSFTSSLHCCEDHFHVSVIFT